MCKPARHRVARRATATARPHDKIDLSGLRLAVKCRPMKTTPLFPCALVAGLLFPGSPLRATNEPKDKTPWKITGQLEEACSCDAACPCWFNSKPTKMTCGGGQVLFIQKGNYGKVKLDGLAIAGMGQSPEGQTMMESFGNWEFLLQLHRRESDSGTTQSIGSDRCEGVDAGRIKENRNSLRSDQPKD